MSFNPTNVLAKLDNNVELLLSKFQEICQLASVEGKNYEVQSVEALQIESDGWTIVRIAEELLNVTRTLRESWVLGQQKNVDPNSDASSFTDDELYALYSKINLLLDDITTQDLKK